MNIPDWPDSRPIAIEDKPFFDNMFSSLQPRVSEFTFAGLYLFRLAHDYRVSRHQDCLIIRGKGYDGSSYALIPLGIETNKSTLLLAESGITIYGADNYYIQSLPPEIPYFTEEERDAFDYIYLREDLATLPGNSYHKKKNRINYFASRHEHTIELFTKAHHADCHSLLDRLPVDETSSHALEIEACHEAIDMADTLGLEGIVITVENNAQAFSLGERLNRHTSVCHFEKGNHFMDGIMQLVNREFCYQLFKECKFVNREQDLGDAGIRGAKLSYHPVELLKKYRLMPIGVK